MEFSGKKALVVGLRRTGVAAARFLVKEGASVTVTDKEEPASFASELDALSGLDVNFTLGKHRDGDFTGADIIVASPGVPMSIPELKMARAKGVEVVSEIEMAASSINAPILGITGANGKSTVTSLLGDMLRRAGNAVFVGGNIGNPLSNMAMSDEKYDMAVVELSSFQLEGIVSFRPKAALLLNITPDHLDRYRDMRAYYDAKARVFMNQREDDWAIINGGDMLAIEAGGDCRARKVYFSATDAPKWPEKAWLDGDEIRLEIEDGKRGSNASGIVGISIERMKLTGAHNRENALAAAAAAYIMGASPQAIEKALATFAGLPHRVQYVGEVDGVRYYDDSKGTNVGAVEKSLAGFAEPVVLIAGGLDKGADFSPLAEPIKKKARAVVLIGAAAEKIHRQIGRAAPTFFAEDMEKAVRMASELARPGDVVLLSPACASFDMFNDYAHRGDAFQEAARKLIEEKGN